VEVEVLGGPRAREAELHVRSTDAVGFVFEMAAALGALDLSIERAVFRTLGDEVFDTFWVTDLQGRPVGDVRSARRLRAATALVRQFIHLLPRSPEPALALRQFSALLRQILASRNWTAELRDLESAPVLATIADLMGVGRFLWEDFLLLQHENLFPVVRDVPALERRSSRPALEREVARAGASIERLNEFKDRELFRIDLRHITGRSGFEEFMTSLSDLADVVLGRAAELVGVPDGPWCLAALGKFGGRELGIASDLDLLAVYDGEEADPCARLVKGLLKAVHGRREGSFEIDLRLRPFGDAGPMASSLVGFREYYSEGGPARPFERLALVKLRPMAGDEALGRRVLEARNAFVYSETPVDLANLLHLRKRQAAELAGPGVVHAKYGPGGLVDVEYFVQVRQIEAGRRDSGVRAPGTLEAVGRLVAGGHLPSDLGAEIATAYLFLRRLLAALRVVRGNARDAAVPPRDSREFDYLVRRLGYASPVALDAEIRQRMSFARGLWDRGA
jgi:glutamate-ammonia-ligase adenylyltransferase